MAVAAESQQQHAETYARSSETLRRLGACALAGATGREAQGIAEEARLDFLTAVTENLATDTQMAELLDVERSRELAYRDGHVVAADGTPMATLVRNGLEVSREAAETDPRMSTQAIRDEGDVLTADIVDTLQPGQVYMAVSMCPDEALADDRQFWRRFGYREGLSFVQTYYRTPDGDTVVSSSFSVGASDRLAWSRVLHEYGINIGPDTHSSLWIRHGYLCDATPEQASAVAGNVRDRYYEAVHAIRHRYSVNEFVETRQETIGRYFEAYIRPLAKALASGKNNEALQGFVRALQGSPAECAFDARIRQELVRVANMDSFAASSAPAMESLIRYALVEELRTGLLGVVSGGETRVDVGEMLNGEPLPMLDRMVRRIEAGVSAGRTYGGCASLELNTYSEIGDGGLANGVGTRQNAYGGKESWKWTTGVCRVKNCPSPTPTEVGPCKVCRHCQRLFDSGRDPASVYTAAVASRKKAAKVAINLFGTKPVARTDAKKHTGTLAPSLSAA